MHPFIFLSTSVPLRFLLCHLVAFFSHYLFITHTIDFIPLLDFVLCNSIHFSFFIPVRYSASIALLPLVIGQFPCGENLSANSHQRTLYSILFQMLSDRPCDMMLTLCVCVCVCVIVCLYTFRLLSPSSVYYLSHIRIIYQATGCYRVHLCLSLCVCVCVHEHVCVCVLFVCAPPT